MKPAHPTLSALSGILSCAAALLLAACASPSSTATPDGHYRVRQGDTLYRIAARFGQSPATLAKWNNLSDPSKIAVGQLLRVGKSGGAPVRHAGAGTPVQARRSIAPTPAPPRIPAMQRPSENPVLARFGDTNKGIDFAGNTGDPVRAAAAGKVLDTIRMPGYGNLVLIGHSQGVITAYGHNERIVVQKGQTVGAGQIIAHMGSSGTDRVKLRFELRVNSAPVNPEPYLPPLPAAAPPPAPAVSAVPAVSAYATPVYPAANGTENTAAPQQEAGQNF